MFRQFLEKKFGEQPFRHWYSSTAVFTAMMAAKANVAMVLCEQFMKIIDGAQ